MADPKQEAVTSLARGVMGAARPEAQAASQMFLNDLVRFRNARPELQPAIQQQVFGRIMKDFPQPIPGMKGMFNLAPNAPNLVVRLPNGNVMKVPRDAELPPGAKVLNKTVDEVRASMPAQLRPAEPPPSSVAPSAVNPPQVADRTASSIEDAALAAARESNQASRAARTFEGADEAAKAAAIESRASTMGPQLPPGGMPAPRPNLTAASPAEQAYRAGQPTREAIQSNAPQNIAAGVGLGALAAGAGRQMYNDMPYRSSGADVGEFSQMDYVPTRPAETSPSEFARLDAISPAQTDISQFSQMDFAPGQYPLPPEMRGDQFSEVAGYTGASPTQAHSEQAPAAAAATQTARQVMADRGATRGSSFPAYGADVPDAPRPLAPERPQQGFFGRLFSDPYAGKSAQDLYTQAQDMQRSGDEYGAHLLIGRAMQMQRPDNMKRGGQVAKGQSGSGASGKDAALHKALEIIHHMLARR